MSIESICFIAIAVCIIGLLYLAAVFSRVNDIVETEIDEPLGDMVDVRSLINKYED
jgi:uncharacterized membrane protein